MAKQRPAGAVFEGVLFPRVGYTRQDAIEYYDAIAPALLPHLRDRPVSLLRFPGSIADESFWEKDAPSFTPEWVRTHPVPRKSDQSFINYIVINDKRSLGWAAGVGAIEIHPFLHTTDDLDRPTHVVFDLDPGPRANILQCCRVAVLLRDYLKELDLQSLAKVSGSKGLQVYAPLNSAVTHAMTEAFARVVANALADQHPRLIVSQMARELRTGRVFIDWSQNANYKTTVAVYSLRTRRDRPLVSAAVTWNEIEAAIRSRKPADLEFSPERTLERVESEGDLFAPVLQLRQELPRDFIATFRRMAPPPKRRRKSAEGDDEAGMVVEGIRLPRPKSQSGRRLFVVVKGKLGNELWLDVRGDFKRWILRPDRRGGASVVAMPAGEFPVNESYFRGQVQEEYRDSVTIEDIGVYERIAGSFESEWLTLFFTGRTLRGEWILEKIQKGSRHRSWSLSPAA